MTAYRIGIIGTGRPRLSEGATGFGMAHIHAQGYLAAGAGEIVAVADIVADHGRAFAAQYGNPTVYTSYRDMLANEQLDIVSVCTWPALHAEMVLAAAGAGVKAIHCEKPMGRTWGEAQAMVQACAERGVQLTFNHQRRFNQPFQVARTMLREGIIGSLQRLEGSCDNLYDWGTHWFDMFGFFNDEAPARWVMGQIDSRTERQVFGVPLEDFGLSYIAYANGVYGLLATGEDNGIGCAIRLIGSNGTIEINWEAPYLRVRRAGEADWRIVEEVTEGVHDAVAYQRSIADLVEALDTGRVPELSASHAINATEIIFATYESSRRRGRVETPLAISDSPFLAMLEAGEIGPRR